MDNRHMKRCSTSLLFKKCKSKLQWDTTSHWSEWPSLKSLQVTNIGKGTEKREPSHTVGGNINWYSHYGEQYAGSLKRLKIQLPYDPEVPLLLSHTTGHIIWENHNSKRCMPPSFHCSTLYNSQETWKQPKCPLTDEWIKRMWYIYTMDYYSANKYSILMHIYGIQKNGTDEPICRVGLETQM